MTTTLSTAVLGTLVAQTRWMASMQDLSERQFKLLNNVVKGEKIDDLSLNEITLELDGLNKSMEIIVSSVDKAIREVEHG